MISQHNHTINNLQIMIISIALYCIEKQYQKIYGWCIEKYLDRKMIQSYDYVKLL